MQEHLTQLWHEVVQQVTRDAHNENLGIFLAGSRPMAVEAGTLVVEFPNKFFRDWVETRHIHQLSDALSELSDTTVSLRLLVTGEYRPAAQPAIRQRQTTDSSPSVTSTPSEGKTARPTDDDRPYNASTNGHDRFVSTATVPKTRTAPPKRATPAPVPVDQTMERTHYSAEEPVASQSLNPKYTFETFVVGSANRFAHAASLAAASEPAGVYNPLFLYGGVGLGKTHLMQAIGHYVLRHKQHMHVAYVSSERFTNDLITSLQNKSMVEFRQRYRNVDVLLIDDIQFIAGKESTQEEFFHTFNALYQANKQIVISSDRPPKEIPTLEDRLRSRFESGLTADIQAPDLETRVAILRQKALSDNIQVPDEVLHLIASNIQSNIRELEGALIRVTAFAAVQQQRITPEVAGEALKEIISATQARPITIRSIQDVVATHFGVKVTDLTGKRRSRAIVHPRQIAMYLARDLTDASLPRIGEQFGGRDHTTVMHACDKIRRDMSEDATLAATVRTISHRIKDRV